MPLIIDSVSRMFDPEQIRKGMLVYARHSSWTEGKGGFVTAAMPHEIAVQYYPGMSNVTNHFFIKADEVADGRWELKWSEDLSEVFEYEVS